MRYPRLEPSGPSVKMGIALGPREAEQLLHAASASGETRGEFIRRLIREELARGDGNFADRGPPAAAHTDN